jgi:hypothetical protein
MNKAVTFLFILIFLLPGLLLAQSPYNLGVSSYNYDMVTDSSNNIYLLWKTGTSTINIGKIVNNALTEVDSYTASISIHVRFTRPRLAVKPDGTEIHTVYLSGNRNNIVHVWRNSSGIWNQTVIWTYANDDWRMAFPAIGVDASGYVHVTCQRYNTVEHNGSSMPHDFIVYWRKTGSWSGRVNIQTNDYPYRDTSMYTDKNGGIHATWKSRYTLGKYRYAASGASLADSSTILIPNVSGSPSLSDIVSFGDSYMDNVGNVHHAYFHFRDETLHHVIKPVGSGSFGSRTQAAQVDNCESCGGCTVYENPWPSVGVATDSKVYVTWAENRCSGAINHVMLAIKDGSSWSIGEVTSTAAISSDGRPVIVVTDTDYFIVWRSNTGTLMLSTDAAVGPPPSITVLTPAGGEMYEFLCQIPIAWTTENLSGNIKISLRTSDDSTGYLVVKDLPYDNSPYNYTIPSELFEIVPTGFAENLTVTYPNGGESIAAGSTTTFTWTSSGAISNVKIEFSPDSGSNWSTLFASVPNTGSYTDTIPAETPASSTCLMRISDAADGSPSDISDAVFTITSGGADSITVSYPNGGESFAAGAGVTFAWSSTGSIANVHIELSTNNGTDWSTLYSSVPNTGSYSGTIPLATTPSTTCLIRISDAADGTPSDTSNAVFTITSSGGTDSITVTLPNGGEIERAGTMQTVTWESTGTIANVKIEFSPDNGSYWGTLFDSVPNTGSYSGIIPPDTPPSDYCLIRISDAADGVPSDVSDAVFSILPAYPISIITPAGGENYTLGVDTIPITWTTFEITGNIKISLRWYDDSTGQLIVKNLPHDTGTYDYPIPSDITPGTYFVRILTMDRVHSVDSNTFSISEPGGTENITVTSPNGGESVNAGNPLTITWTSIGAISNVRIELSTDTGGFWSEIINSTPNDGSFSYLLPPDTASSSECLIRISDASDGSPSDTSDNTFNILPQLPISITNPLGGETYTRGSSTITINWVTSGVSGNVKITLRYHDDSTGSLIVKDIPHDTGTHNYPVPADISPGIYFIRILTMDRTAQDDSEQIIIN